MPRPWLTPAPARDREAEDTGRDRLARCPFLLPSALAGMGIVILSQTDPSGFLSHDSVYYLRLAESLRDGLGYRIPGSPLADPFCAVWPIGYPAAVAAASFFTGFDVFWSSKLVNALACALIAAVLTAHASHKSALPAGTILLAAPVLLGVTMSLSEAPFIACTVAFAAALDRYRETGSRGWLLACAIASQASFLFRYIGAFTVVVSLLYAALLMVRGRRAAGAWLFLASIAVASVSGGILVHNRRLTGHATGISRIRLQDPSLQTAPTMLRSQFSQLASLFATRPGRSASRQFATRLGNLWSLLVFAGLAGIVMRGSRDPVVGTHNGLARVLTVTGAVYWLAVFAVLADGRIPKEDIENGRLLLPATVLILSALLLQAHPRAHGSFRRAAWLSVPVSSYFFNVVLIPVYSLFGANLPTYAGHREAVLARFAPAGPGDIVITDDVYAFLLKRNTKVRLLESHENLAEVVQDACRRATRVLLDRRLAASGLPYATHALRSCAAGEACGAFLEVRGCPQRPSAFRGTAEPWRREDQSFQHGRISPLVAGQPPGTAVRIWRYSKNQNPPRARHALSRWPEVETAESAPLH